MSSKTEGNNFDLIRFFFASLVILSHAYPMATGTERLEPLWRFSRGQLTLGRCRSTASSSSAAT